MTIYNSPYRHLVVSGCSFTHNNHETACTWGNSVAVWTGMKIHNLAMPGAGNTHIKNSTVLYLERNQLDPQDTLVIIMWSGVERIDWITDRSRSHFLNEYSFEYRYDDCNELVLGGSWWAQDNKTPTHLRQTLLEYSKYQSESSLALSSWLMMNDLDTYLASKKYHYYFTAFQDIFYDAGSAECWINYADELEKLQLTLRREPWLFDFEDHSQYLGEFVRARDMLYDDGFHPTWQGHELWAQQVLIPRLIQDKVITPQ